MAGVVPNYPFYKKEVSMNVLEEVMTFAEATAYLEKNANYLADMVRAGKLIEGTHYRTAGRVKLIIRSVVDEIKQGVFEAVKEE